MTFCDGDEKILILTGKVKINIVGINGNGDRVEWGRILILREQWGLGIHV